MSRCTSAALALLGLLACRGSDPQPLEFIVGEDFWASNAILAGGGSSEIVAYSRWNGDGFTVRILRHDAAAPDDLELVGEVELGRTLGPSVEHLAVSDGVVAASGSYGITFIDLASPSLAVSTLPLSRPTDALAVNGRRVLTASADVLTLIDLDDPASPASMVAASPVTSILATQGTFVAFTTSGYVHVAPGPTVTWQAVDDAVVRNFRGAFADGQEALVAGPSLTLGRTRVVRLDLRSPGAPVVLRSHEVVGEFAAFAWDGGDTSVVAIATGDTFSAIHEGHVVREQEGAFTSFGIPLPQRYARLNPIAAHAGHLFALTDWNFGFYAIR